MQSDKIEPNHSCSPTPSHFLNLSHSVKNFFDFPLTTASCSIHTHKCELSWAAEWPNRWQEGKKTTLETEKNGWIPIDQSKKMSCKYDVFAPKLFRSDKIRFKQFSIAAWLKKTDDCCLNDFRFRSVFFCWCCCVRAYRGRHVECGPSYLYRCTTSILSNATKTAPLSLIQSLTHIHTPCHIQ